MRTLIAFLFFSWLFHPAGLRAQVWQLTPPAYQYKDSLFADSATIGHEFQFLVPFVKNKRIIFLGEEGHKLSAFNALKTSLALYLADREQFDILLFESPLDAAFLGLNVSHPVSAKSAGDSLYLFPIWCVSENEPLLARATGPGRKLFIGGIDPQTFSSFTAADSYATQPIAKAIMQATDLKPATQHLLYELDSALCTLLREHRAACNWLPTPEGYSVTCKDTIEYIRITHALAQTSGAYASAIGQLPAPLTASQRILRLALRNRLWLPAITQDPRRYAIARDSMMAANLTYIADSLYPGRKIIVWAHDGHIAKAPVGDRDHQSCIGMFLPGRLRSAAYAIALKMNTHILNNGTAIAKKGKHYRATLHYSLDQLGPAFFLDVSTAINLKLIAPRYEYAYVAEGQVLPASYQTDAVYDGVFYIRTTGTSSFSSRYMHE